jgi:hypothetical protein
VNYFCFKFLFDKIRSDNVLKIFIQDNKSLMRVLVEDYKDSIIILLSNDFYVKIYRLELSEISSHIRFCGSIEFMRSRILVPLFKNINMMLPKNLRNK